MGLPRIRTAGKEETVVTEKDKYSSIRNVGPESLRHFKRTYKEGTQAAESPAGTYNPDRPIIIPVREDKQYRSWKEVPKPEAVACVVST